MESFDVKMMKWLTCRVPGGHEATSKVGRENLLENKINKKYTSEIHVPESYWSKTAEKRVLFFLPELWNFHLERAKLQTQKPPLM